MKIKLTVLFFLFSFWCFGAANIFTNGAGGNTWGTAGNWSLAAIPVAGDGNVPTFTVASPNCTVATINRTCGGIDFTGYINTFTLTTNLSVSGSIIFGTLMAFGGAGSMTIAATGTMTSNGVTFPNNFIFANTITYTLADNWVISGVASFTGAATVNGNNFSCNGLTVNANTGSGSTTFILTGGTWSGTSGLRNSVTINGGGTVTISSVSFGTGTVTYTAGTLSISGTFSAFASCSFDWVGQTLNNLTISNAGTTITMKSGLNISGGLTCTVATAANHSGFVSSSGGTQRPLTLLQGATQDLGFVNATDIDSNSGQTIRTFKGTLSNATNWALLVANTTIGNMTIY